MLAFVIALAIAGATSSSAPAEDLNVDGLAVPASQLQSLMATFLSAKSSGKIAVTVDAKPDASMPAYDQHWHYAGSQIDQAGDVKSEVWISDDDVTAAKSAAGKHEEAVEIASGILLALMDSGIAGSYWKDF